MLDKLFAYIGDLPRAFKYLVFLGFDLIVLSVAYALSILLTISFKGIGQIEYCFWHYSLVVSTSLVAICYLGFYQSAVRFASLRILVVVFVSAIITGILYYGYSNVLDLEQLDVSSAVIFGLLTYLILGGSRLVISAYYKVRLNQLKDKVIIYGAGSAGRQLAESISSGQEYIAVAFLDDDPGIQGVVVKGVKVYSPNRMHEILSKHDIKKVLLALPSIGISKRKSIIENIQKHRIPVQTIPGLKDVVEGKMRIDEFQNVSIEDLLGREPVPPNQELLHHDIQNKTVMVTGAGGSIGSELCRQIIALEPKQLLLFEGSEYALYSIHTELMNLTSENNFDVEVYQFLGTVQDEEKLLGIMSAFHVDSVYHAAAYKHVPLVEYNVAEGIENNILGTLYTAKAAIAAGVHKFVLISTDKAVRPTNVMGATKRFAELVLQGLAVEQPKTCFTMVRFGNVLGSSGSVIPLFDEQIRRGGPVTVTHKDITRYFMTIPEAAQLVIQAGAMGKGGDVFVLDMGEPEKISKLAKKLIRLMGLQVKSETNPDGDIEVVYTGLRPGEKLYEELLIGDNVGKTDHPRIMTAKEVSLPWDELSALIAELVQACKTGEQEQAREILLKAPTGYRPSSDIVDYLWVTRRA